MDQTQTPADLRAHFHQLLKQFNTTMLVTHAADGRLRARPMGLVHVEEDGRLWFLTEKESAKVHEIEANPRVHLVCQHDRSVYLSLDGHAEVVHDRAKVAEIWQEPFRAFFPGGKDDPHIVLIAVQPEEGEFWDNEGTNKFKYLYQTVKAYATGSKPEFTEGEQHGHTQL